MRFPRSMAMFGCASILGAVPAAAQVHDSAGVAIVQNPPLARAPRIITLSPRPAVDIGRLDGPEMTQLFHVVAGTRTRNGRIVIANAGSFQLRFYDAGGKPLTAVGGRGEGPGEFQDLAVVRTGPGDSLYTFDNRLRRVSVYTPAGEYRRSYGLDAGSVAQLPRFEGVMADGTVIGTAGHVYSTRNSTTGLKRDTLLVLRFAADGSFQSVLGRLPGTESYAVAKDRSVSVSDAVLGHSSAVTVGANALFLGANDDYRIDAMDARGHRTRSIRSAEPVRRVTDADMRAEIERRMQAVNRLPPRFRASQQSMLDAMPTPATFPAWRSITAAQDDRVWVKSWTLPGQPTEWAVYDAAGALALVVHGPPDVTLLAAGEDWALMRWQDGDDIEHVGLWDVK